MFWVNGQPGSTISLSDRSFQYGDGCFTTIMTKNALPQYWPLHIERMQACLDLLGIDSPDWAEVGCWLDRAAMDAPLAGLKLHISRGEGGRGYSPAECDCPVVTISAFSYPEHYLGWRADGVELGVCERRLGIMPLLAGHKHNNRLEQVLLRAELDQKGYQDGLVRDINDNVIETTMANLFWVRDSSLYTPDMESCGVAGVVRRLVIRQAKKLGLEVCIGQFKLEHLEHAHEVFMTNSILGVAPVKSIAGLDFPLGSITRSFQENINS